ncbi:MAG: hypothetical protein ABIP80_02225, partial [Ferruginibacter sp.]
TICFTVHTAIAQGTYPSSDSSRHDEQEQTDESVPIPDTTLIISQISIPADTIEALKNMKQFAYVKSMDSLLTVMQHEQQRKMRTTGRSISFLDRLFNSSFLKILAWLTVGIIISFVLIKLINTRGFFIFNKFGKQVVQGEEDASEVVHANYEKLVHQSVSAGDYRLGVKYQFLKTLHLLSNHSYINYTADKTNFTYLHEIDDDKKKAFTRLINHYEYIWYGSADIGKETYLKIETYFNDFNKKI